MTHISLPQGGDSEMGSCAPWNDRREPPLTVPGVGASSDESSPVAKRTDLTGWVL